MDRKIRSILIYVLYGFGGYTISQFLRFNEERKEILITIGLAIIIGVIIDFVVTDKIYRHKYLRHIVPLAVVNLVLIPYMVYRDEDIYREPSFWVFLLLWNIGLAALYSYIDYSRKKRVNQLLASKINKLDI